jgi:hypothetical protein
VPRNKIMFWNILTTWLSTTYRWMLKTNGLHVFHILVNFWVHYWNTSAYQNLSWPYTLSIIIIPLTMFSICNSFWMPWVTKKKAKFSWECKCRVMLTKLILMTCDNFGIRLVLMLQHSNWTWIQTNFNRMFRFWSK